MMFDKETLPTLLNLPDIAIDRVVLAERKTIKIYLHSTLEGTHCHCCGQPIEHDYGLGQEIALRHFIYLWVTGRLDTVQVYECCLKSSRSLRMQSANP
jgi:hypothetical protein